MEKALETDEKPNKRKQTRRKPSKHIGAVDRWAQKRVKMAERGERKKTEGRVQ